MAAPPPAAPPATSCLARAVLWPSVRRRVLPCGSLLTRRPPLWRPQATGEEALSFIDQAPALPDLVLLDVTLPGISGFEASGQRGGGASMQSMMWATRWVQGRCQGRITLALGLGLNPAQ